MSLDISNDYEVVDGFEVVTLTSVDGHVVDPSGVKKETKTSYAVSALRRAVSENEISQFGGMLAVDDVLWLVPANLIVGPLGTLIEPKPGWRLTDASGAVWRASFVERRAFGTKFALYTKKP